MALPVVTGRRVAAVSRRLVSAAGVAVSPFSGTMQVQDWGGVWWSYGLSIQRMSGREGRETSALLSKLRGPVNVFLYEDPGAARPSDVPHLHGTPVVDGSDQLGGQLETAGWDVSTAVMRSGDFFSLGEEEDTRLYQLTEDAISDAAGNAVLSFIPDLRLSPLDATEIEVDRPRVALRLLQHVPTELISGGKYSFTLDAREAL